MHTIHGLQHGDDKWFAYWSQVRFSYAEIELLSITLSFHEDYGI